MATPEDYVNAAAKMDAMDRDEQKERIAECAVLGCEEGGGYLTINPPVAVCRWCHRGMWESSGYGGRTTVHTSVLVLNP